ncbi:uncharacterized protein LOC118227475 [Anguilla anguilla]|uniref:uncharacterized protein LOC118227475 n=1 Tax=Anguilla anguilla TaxID=7936 RepID=UPI0015AFC7F7|nr:uncharacterized protein LOC118227475 [Anguilla anguilla]
MALEILKSLKDLKRYDNEDAVDLLKKLCQLYFQHEDDKGQRSLGDQLVREGGTELLVKILIGFSTAGFFSSNSIWFPTYYTLSAIWNLSDASFLFAKELGKLDALQYLLAVLDHGPYKEKLGEKNVQYLVKASLCILHNVAKVPHNRPLLRQNNGVQKIAYYTRVEDELLKVVSIMTLGYIIDEDESELIMDESGAVEIMVKLLQGALNSKDRRCRGYTPFEIAEGLTLIATCERNKMKIYECGAVPKCLDMMKSEDFRDRLFATKVIWQLAFDESLREKLKENGALMDMLDSLSKDTSKAVTNAAQGAQWVIKKQAEEKSKAKPDSKSVKQTSGHVMISYQWDDQKTLLEVNKTLQNAGIKVWMDVEQMAGSTLQAMAEAVEKAYAVIICVSPKYKDSPNCRTEAEYTFQLRKEIIPLMMEQNYKPDGWLGALLGAKLWIDFSDNCNFEESIKQLIKEIKGRTPPEENDVVIAVSSNDQQTNASSKDPPLITWTKEHVGLWLKENGLDFCLNVFAEYDGSLIYQLQRLRREAPEFFYASLRRDMGFSTLTEILKFLRALEKTDGP